jgi:hypothetical protein
MTKQVKKKKRKPTIKKGINKFSTQSNRGALVDMGRDKK